MAKNRNVNALTTNDEYIRFWGKVNITANNNLCWEWQRCLDISGYGSFTINKVSEKAHRIAYYNFYKEQPGDRLVCHTCDNRKCVNPNHLFLGTYKDNYYDAKKKGRETKPICGSKNKMAKLTENTIFELVDKYKSGGFTLEYLAKSAGISYPVLSNIFSGKHWAHLGIKLKRRTSLKKEDVINIKSMYADGKTYLEIAEIYGMKKQSIGDIIRGRNWKNI